MDTAASTKEFLALGVTALEQSVFDAGLVLGLCLSSCRRPTKHFVFREDEHPLSSRETFFSFGASRPGFDKFGLHQRVGGALDTSKAQGAR